MTIYRRDDETGACYWLMLSSPLEQSPYDVEATDDWELEAVFWNNDPASCDEDYPGLGAEATVPDAFGTVTMTLGPIGLPCTVDIDVQLQLLANPDPPVYVDICQDGLDLGICDE